MVLDLLLDLLLVFLRLLERRELLLFREEVLLVVVRLVFLGVDLRLVVRFFEDVTLRLEVRVEVLLLFRALLLPVCLLAVDLRYEDRVLL